MDPTGAFDLQALLFQIFFSTAGAFAGIRLTEDFLAWKETRTQKVNAGS